jgi:hypothetical protein
MALIALRNIRCIDYLAYGTIFTRGDVSSEKKGVVYFPARKAADERWGVVSRLMTFSEMGIFSRITSRDENSHETSSHEISLMRSRNY